MNLPPDHVPDTLQLPEKCDLHIQLKINPKYGRKWDFFWAGLTVMLWGFSGFRRAVVRKYEKRKQNDQAEIQT